MGKITSNSSESKQNFTREKQDLHVKGLDRFPNRHLGYLLTGSNLKVEIRTCTAHAMNTCTCLQHAEQSGTAQTERGREGVRQRGRGVGWRRGREVDEADGRPTLGRRRRRRRSHVVSVASSAKTTPPSSKNKTY